MVTHEKIMAFDSVFATIGSMTENLGNADFFPEFRQLLIGLFEPQSIVALVFETGRLPLVVDHWIPDPGLRRIFCDTYTDFGYRLDPFHDLAMSGFENGAYRLRDVAPDHFFRNRASRRYYRQSMLIDELGALHRMRDGRVAHLSLGRHKGHPGFGKRPLPRLQSLSPALMALLAAHVDRMSDSAKPEPVDAPQLTLRDEFRCLLPAEGRRVTPRECEVASLVVQGHSTASIGLNLGISPQTVKVHRRNIYRKLGVSSLAELCACIPASRTGPFRQDASCERGSVRA